MVTTKPRPSVDALTADTALESDAGDRSLADAALSVAVAAVAKRAIGFTFRYPLAAGATLIAFFLFVGRLSSNLPDSNARPIKLRGPIRHR
jgi:hypothetical protein